MKFRRSIAQATVASFLFQLAMLVSLQENLFQLDAQGIKHTCEAQSI